MNMRYRSYSFGFHLTPWVKRLIIANAVVLLVIWAVPAPITYWLAFEPAHVLTRPWGAVTYMFVHGGFWHLLINMLMLFFFGPPLEDMWGGREFLKYYVIAGLGGAAFSFVFAYNTAVIGASAAVLGIMLAFAMNWPDMPIYIWGILPIKAKWLITFLAVVNLMSAVGGSADGVAHFAHLGGLAAGFLYLKLDYRVGDEVRRLRKRAKRRGFSVTTGTGAPKPRATKRTRKDEDKLLDEVDRVLDKISESGLGSLSDEERRILDEVSKRYRHN
ncbi:MAG TPA: rhomboid family intramembrane serine protease [Longimicrobiales bacterium]|nr:rhomboid family intramembrane serine protease [Longimicrobiales bacterium]